MIVQLAINAASAPTAAKTGAKAVHTLPMVPMLNVVTLLERLADALELAEVAQDAAP